MNFTIFRAALATLLLTLSANVIGATIAEDWSAGKQAFQAGDYASALVYFETARDAGLTGPAVYYNIAVSQYKLGRYSASTATFELIARQYPKLRGLAEYNLGLTADRMGAPGDAREHFRKAYELSRADRKLQVLASRQLRRLEPEVRTASRWTGAFGVRAGIDDNVALLDESGLAAGTTTDSPMTDAFASFSGPWSGRSGIRVEGSAYLVKYFDADDFDQSEIRGGVFYEWRPPDWRLQFGVQASVGTIGGDAFDRKVGARARVARYLSRNAAVDLRYTYDDVSEGDSVFAVVAGTRQRFDARYRWYQDGHRFQLRYRLETNDRLDPGVSPDRSQFGVDYRYQPERRFGFEAGINLRNSDYKDLAIPREEDLTTVRGALTYIFGDNWLALLEYRNSSNDSTDPTFSYDRGQVTIGARKYF